MVRVSRIFIDYAPYHVYLRGNQKQDVFRSEEDFIKYLGMLKKAKRKCKILLYAYCLMPNHIHLLIEALHSRNISKFMHWLSRGYACYFNKEYNKVGHLWQGRFQNRPILKDQYLINVASYIENNPVRAGIVTDPADYPWSSYRERCLLTEKNILDPIKIDCSLAE